LVRGFQSLVGGQATDAAQQGGKILTVDVLHGEKMLAVYLTDVVNAAHIGMRDLAGIANFSMKAGKSRGIVLQGSGKQLESDNVAEFEILGAVNLAHAAAPQQSHDSIAFNENRSRRESAVARRVRTDGNWHRHDNISIRLQGWRIENGNGTPA
jgi:hypothetical protein